MTKFKGLKTIIDTSYKDLQKELKANKKKKLQLTTTIDTSTYDNLHVISKKLSVSVSSLVNLLLKKSLKDY